MSHYLVWTPLRTKSPNSKHLEVQLMNIWHGHKANKYVWYMLKRDVPPFNQNQSSRQKVWIQPSNLLRNHSGYCHRCYIKQRYMYDYFIKLWAKILITVHARDLPSCSPQLMNARHDTWCEKIMSTMCDVHIYTHAHVTCIHIHTHTHLYTYTYTHTHIHTYRYTDTEREREVRESMYFCAKEGKYNTIEKPYYGKWMENKTMWK